jgi:hypothetical protein
MLRSSRFGTAPTPPGATKTSSKSSESKVVKVVPSAGLGLNAANRPQELLDLTANADKKWHTQWKPDDDLLAFPHPFRACLTGPPNSGKSTTILNIIMRANPPYSKVHVIYPGGNAATGEYDSLQPKELVTFHDSIPNVEVFKSVKNGAVKTCVVVDDFELKELGPEARGHLDRLVGHVSTHRMADVFVCSQQWVNVPTIARRCCNVFILWKPRDSATIHQISKGVGEDMVTLFKFSKQPRDSIWIDKTVDSPCPLRLNGYTPIGKNSSDSEEESEGEMPDFNH